MVKMLVRRYSEVFKGKKFVSQRPLAKFLAAVVNFLENGISRPQTNAQDNYSDTKFDLFAKD